MDPTSLLEFWFGTPDQPATDRSAFWFGADPQVDAEIRHRFESWIEPAASGQLDNWATAPTGRLALILLLDQIPRNIHRNSPRAYSHDRQAQALCREGLRVGQDRDLEVLQRAFFYMPLEHAESLALQTESVSRFQALMDEAPPDLRQQCLVFLDYAKQHREIIARFGRFPHRNAALGRDSTSEEETYLARTFPFTSSPGRVESSRHTGGDGQP